VLEEIILVRYGEIALKSSYVRKKFEETLILNIKKALKQEKIDFIIKKERGRIFVETLDISRTNNVLKHIFGIVSYSPCFKIKVDFKEISKIANIIAEKKLDKITSFAIRSKRTGTHDFTSQDLSEEIGKSVVEKTALKVDLTNPDLEIFIEIREQDCYIYSEKIYGTGGMPLGTQGNTIAIIQDSSSILASWYMMKRGCNVCFFLTDEKLHDDLVDFTEKWYVKPDIIFDESKDFFININKISRGKKAEAFVTGHNISQNPDESMDHIKEFKNNLILPVLHPLISMTKDEIKEKSKDVGINI